MNKTIEQRLQALEDREAIIRLKAQYVNYNDGGWSGPTHAHAQAVADQFVEDGIWDGPGHGYAKGRAEIKALFEKYGQMPFIIHYVTNPLIDVNGDTATGHWHALVTAVDASDTSKWILGFYKDQYVRTTKGWKFKVLHFETAMITPYELSWGKTLEQILRERADSQAVST